LLKARIAIYTPAMRRLAWWMLMSIFGCAVGILLAHGAGSTRLPSLSAVFTTPDGAPCVRPCLFGVQPGTTSVEEAATLLINHPVTRDFDLVSRQPFRMEGHADRIIMVSFNGAEDGKVDEITMSIYVRYGSVVGEVPHQLPDSGALGDILSTFGTPDFIQITNGGDPILAFVDQGLLASLIRSKTLNQHIRPRTPLSRLTLFRYEPCPPSAFIYVFPEWHGLAGFGYYGRVHAIDTMVRRMNSQGTTFAPCQFSQ
jgi:hypothetical protein